MSFQESETSRSIANALLETGAVILKPKDPFTWTSGWKSPIYCDNRKTLSFPGSREIITDNLRKAIGHHYPEVEMIAGVATAGIPQAAIIADRLKLPMIYVRDKAKGHGRENKIEGHFQGGEKVVLIEDLISTGGSSLAAALSLKQSGMDVMGVLSTFSYGFEEAHRKFAEGEVEFISLCRYQDLLPIAMAKGIVKEEDLPVLENWRKDPSNWG